MAQLLTLLDMPDCAYHLEKEEEREREREREREIVRARESERERAKERARKRERHSEIVESSIPGSLGLADSSQVSKLDSRLKQRLLSRKNVPGHTNIVRRDQALRQLPFRFDISDRAHYLASVLKDLKLRYRVWGLGIGVWGLGF